MSEGADNLFGDGTALPKDWNDGKNAHAYLVTEYLAGFPVNSGIVRIYSVDEKCSATTDIVDGRRRERRRTSRLYLERVDRGSIKLREECTYHCVKAIWVITLELIPSGLIRAISI